MNTPLQRPPRLAYGALVLLTSLALAGAGMVWTRTELTSQGYELARLQARRRELQGEIDALERDVQRLSTAARIEPLARNLGLVYPEAGQVIPFRAADVASLPARQP